MRVRGGDREGVEEREADAEALADVLADNVGVAVEVGRGVWLLDFVARADAEAVCVIDVDILVDAVYDKEGVLPAVVKGEGVPVRDDVVLALGVGGKADHTRLYAPPAGA